MVSEMLKDVISIVDSETLDEPMAATAVRQPAATPGAKRR